VSSRFGPCTGYLAPLGFLPQMQAELSAVVAVHERLVIAAGPAQTSVWAENIWYEVESVHAPSIGIAAKELKSRQRNWWPYAWHLHRRHALIQEKLPHVAANPLRFPNAKPLSTLGSFALLDEQTLLLASRCSSPFPNGAPAFAEPSSPLPPSRAYLKLWESFTRLGVQPKPGERCIDLGASPGGWTWVLAHLGVEVTGYDRAPLDPSLLAMPNVRGVIGDAFQTKPEKIGAIDWLFSDVICYPERMLAHIQEWRASGLCKNYVCTIKFQGDAHYGVIAELLRIEGSQLMHLHCNKHELTWVLLADQGAAVSP